MANLLYALNMLTPDNVRTADSRNRSATAGLELMTQDFFRLKHEQAQDILASPSSDM